jgi:hypothetical protein
MEIPDSYDQCEPGLSSFIEIKKKVTRQLDADIIDLIIYVLSWFMQDMSVHRHVTAMVGSSSCRTTNSYVVV